MLRFTHNVSLSMRLLILCIVLLSGFTSLLSRPYHQPTRKEIQHAVAVVKADSRFPLNAQFISVGPADPVQSEVLRKGDSAASVIGIVLRDRIKRKVYEVFNDTQTGAVLEWRRVDDVQPMLTFDDFDSAAVIVRAHEGWVRGLRRRGLTPDDVVLDTWASGVPYKSFPARLVRVLTYQKSSDKNNLYYDRPVEGLVCTVNLDAHRVTEFYDTDEAPVPRSMGDFDLEYKNNPRALAPLKIQQNAKKAVKIRDNEITWMGWNFSVLLHAREGLVIHRVRFDDKGKQRSVMHRIGLSEMVVPYGDTSKYWYWRSAFDVGEYGVGNLTTPLTIGVDVPNNAQTLDAVLAKPDGSPLEIESAIAVYERDAGILWKHADPFTGDNRMRRGRELVVMSITTVGNYDYSLAYVFGLDGSIKVEVGLTGILLAKGIADTTDRGLPSKHMFGAMVAPNTLAPNHQHFFNFRIDLDVDGTSNSVSELQMWSPPRAENRYGNAIAMDDYEWLYENEAHGDVSTQYARTWKVSSTTTKNKLGGFPSYMIVPGSNAFPFVEPTHSLWDRATFLKHHLWSTRFHDDEMYAAGSYPNQCFSKEGVEAYSKNNESLRGNDVVLWYTVGITHHPRPEEWPIMNVHTLGFSIIPVGFYDKNPALYIPPRKK